MWQLRYVVLWLGLCGIAQAGPLPVEQVPAPLQPWVEWVLHDSRDYRCPFTHNEHAQRHCIWPSQLQLQLDARGGSFAQQVRVYQRGFVPLPGDARHWPQEVQINNRPALVISQGERPVLELAPGQYAISGRFRWDRLPETLQLSERTGLVELQIRGQAMAFPELEANGQLWLQDRAAERAEVSGDRLELHVFRRLVDDIPTRVLTRLQLEVAGAQREVVLDGALLEEFKPLRLSSPLPARLEQDGRLRVQVRPGSWTIELEARALRDLTRFDPAQAGAPWPPQEVWVFEARHAIRLVDVDAPVVDPRQTLLPPDWQQLPAYVLQAGDSLKLNVIRRGDPEPEPDQLVLRRSLWLDFSGRGYTVQDRISGSMTRGWRLETEPDLQLGRVDLHGVPQFITRLPDSERVGVEVRRGQIELSADSRYEASLRHLPASGWAQDFHRVSAELHLPPGWQLFAASGVDNVPQTWLQQWTLLDLFLVLILSLAVYRLWDWHWGSLALLTLGLIWHEPWAPQWAWISVLIAIALLRVVPAGRFTLAVHWYRNLSLVALVLIVIPFAAHQVRSGLYPQLELPGQMAASTVMDAREREPVSRELMRSELDRVPSPSPMISKAPAPAESPKAPDLYSQFDPEARLQTGPGLPDWQWRSVELGWNGPVQAGQQLGLVLIPPSLNMVLHFLRVVLVVILAGLMFGIQRQAGRVYFKPPFSFSVTPILLAGVLVLPLLPATGQAAEAGYPPPQLLEQLKQRLLAAPDCVPACVDAPRLHFELTETRLALRLELHAQEALAVPLPGQAQHWLPQRVLLNDQPVEALYRDGRGRLWLAVPAGRHQLSLDGVLRERNEISLALPLKPRQVTYQARGWNVDGVHEHGQADAQLQFTRLRQAGQPTQLAALEPGSLPPFVRVERRLLFGLEWQVHTRVVRASPRGTPVLLEIPLLAGEAPLNPELRVQNQRVLVNMGPEQNVFEWRSALDRGVTGLSLELDAPTGIDWVEIWRADVSPLWHLRSSGLAVVHHQDSQQNWLPEWRPWPGEQVRLELLRPQGVAGQTLTLDSSRLELSPGQRVTAASLSLALRSSQGGQHHLQLPEQAVLQSVQINGVTQPIRQEGRQVTLPLVPGSQTVTLNWQDAAGLSWRYASPEVDLGLAGTNSRIQLTLGQDRWMLFTGGPRMGPAVLYWGVLIVIALIALGLSRLRFTPLKFHHWLLLGIGLSQLPLMGAVFVVAWLLLLGLRGRLSRYPEDVWFNVMQVGLGFLTVMALIILFSAVQQGLLGTPDMHVAGNLSDASELNWYQDRSGPLLPEAWVVSVPLLAYRLLMLAWALWLAFSLLNWLRWGWQCYARDGIWRNPPSPIVGATPRALPGEKPATDEPGEKS